MFHIERAHQVMIAKKNPIPFIESFESHLVFSKTDMFPQSDKFVAKKLNIFIAATWNIHISNGSKLIHQYIRGQTHKPLKEEKLESEMKKHCALMEF
jgi:hypothetical protein